MAMTIPEFSDRGDGYRRMGGFRIQAQTSPFGAEAALEALTLQFELRGLASEAVFQAITMDGRGAVRLQACAPSGMSGAGLVRLRRAARAFASALRKRGIPCVLERGRAAPGTSAKGGVGTI